MSEEKQGKNNPGNDFLSGIDFAIAEEKSAGDGASDSIILPDLIDVIKGPMLILPEPGSEADGDKKHGDLSRCKLIRFIKVNNRIKAQTADFTIPQQGLNPQQVPSSKWQDVDLDGKKSWFLFDNNSSYPRVVCYQLDDGNLSQMCLQRDGDDDKPDDYWSFTHGKFVGARDGNSNYQGCTDFPGGTRSKLGKVSTDDIDVNQKEATFTCQEFDRENVAHYWDLDNKCWIKLVPHHDQSVTFYKFNSVSFNWEKQLLDKNKVYLLYQQDGMPVVFKWNKGRGCLQRFHYRLTDQEGRAEVHAYSLWNGTEWKQQPRITQAIDSDPIQYIDDAQDAQDAQDAHDVLSVVKRSSVRIYLQGTHTRFTVVENYVSMILETIRTKSIEQKQYTRILKSLLTNKWPDDLDDQFCQSLKLLVSPLAIDVFFNSEIIPRGFSPMTIGRLRSTILRCINVELAQYDGTEELNYDTSTDKTIANLNSLPGQGDETNNFIRNIQALADVNVDDENKVDQIWQQLHVNNIDDLNLFEFIVDTLCAQDIDHMSPLVKQLCLAATTSEGYAKWRDETLPKLWLHIKRKRCTWDGRFEPLTPKAFAKPAPDKKGEGELERYLTGDRGLYGEDCYYLTGDRGSDNKVSAREKFNDQLDKLEAEYKKLIREHYSEGERAAIQDNISSMFANLKSPDFFSLGDNLYDSSKKLLEIILFKLQQIKDERDIKAIIKDISSSGRTCGNGIVMRLSEIVSNINNEKDISTIFDKVRETIIKRISSMHVKRHEDITPGLEIHVQFQFMQIAEDRLLNMPVGAALHGIEDILNPERLLSIDGRVKWRLIAEFNRCYRQELIGELVGLWKPMIEPYFGKNLLDAESPYKYKDFLKLEPIKLLTESGVCCLPELLEYKAASEDEKSEGEKCFIKAEGFDQRLREYCAAYLAKEGFVHDQAEIINSIELMPELLIKSALYGDWDTVKACIEKIKFSPYILKAVGTLVLKEIVEICQDGYEVEKEIEIVEELIKKGLDLTDSVTGEILVELGCVAIQQRKEPIVRLLAESGKLPNKLLVEIATTVITSGRNRDKGRMIKILLSRAASIDPTLLLTVQQKHGWKGIWILLVRYEFLTPDQFQNDINKWMQLIQTSNGQDEKEIEALSRLFFDYIDLGSYIDESEQFSQIPKHIQIILVEAIIYQKDKDLFEKIIAKGFRFNKSHLIKCVENYISWDILAYCLERGYLVGQGGADHKRVSADEDNPDNSHPRVALNGADCKLLCKLAIEHGQGKLAKDIIDISEDIKIDADALLKSQAKYGWSCVLEVLEHVEPGQLTNPKSLERLLDCAVRSRTGDKDVVRLLWEKHEVNLESLLGKKVTLFILDKGDEFKLVHNGMASGKKTNYRAKIKGWEDEKTAEIEYGQAQNVKKNPKIEFENYSDYRVHYHSRKDWTLNVPEEKQVSAIEALLESGYILGRQKLLDQAKVIEVEGMQPMLMAYINHRNRVEHKVDYVDSEDNSDAKSMVPEAPVDQELDNELCAIGIIKQQEELYKPLLECGAQVSPEVLLYAATKCGFKYILPILKSNAVPNNLSQDDSAARWGDLLCAAALNYDKPGAEEVLELLLSKQVNNNPNPPSGEVLPKDLKKGDVCTIEKGGAFHLVEVTELNQYDHNTYVRNKYLGGREWYLSHHDKLYNTSQRNHLTLLEILSDSSKKEQDNSKVIAKLKERGAKLPPRANSIPPVEADDSEHGEKYNMSSSGSKGQRSSNEDGELKRDDGLVSNSAPPPGRFSKIAKVIAVSAWLSIAICGGVASHFIPGSSLLINILSPIIAGIVGLAVACYTLKKIDGINPWHVLAGLLLTAAQISSVVVALTTSVFPSLIAGSALITACALSAGFSLIILTGTVVAMAVRGVPSEKHVGDSEISSESGEVRKFSLTSKRLSFLSNTSGITDGGERQPDSAYDSEKDKPDFETEGNHPDFECVG